jgi:hypothetical protein
VTKRETDVLEFIQIGGASRVDREKGIIYGAKLLGAKSKNGGRYPRAAREAAKQLYEGIVINVNHPRREKPGEERKVEERFGVASNIQVTDEGTFADVAYLKSHPMADSVAEAAERNELSNIFGFSHNAITVQSHHDGELVHESISKVRSVDLVADPATTKGVFESMDPAISPDAGAPAGGDMTLQMFLDKATSIFQGEGDPGAKAKQISALAKTLLKVKDDIDSVTKDKPSESSGGKPKEDDSVNESTQPKDEAAELRAENERLKRREKARNVLESAGLPADEARVTALSRAETEEETKALVATWKTADPKPSPAKPKSVPASVLESKEGDKPKPGKWDDPKAAAAALLGR